MATVNKNFKIKSGLVVEGTTGTIDGEDILTKAQADIDYIIAEVGGSGVSTNTPDTLVLRDGSGNFAAGTVTANVTGDLTGDVTGDLTGDVTGNVTGDLTGDVTGNVTGDVTGNVTGDLTGNVTGNVTGDVTGTVSSLSNHDTDDLSEGATRLYFTNQRALDATSSAYDAAGAAASAQTAAQSYADGLAVNYDAAGAASTAETNANNYTNTALEDYTATSSLDSTVGGYGYLKSADLSGYATESYVGTAIDNLVDGAPGLLDTLNEIAAAINDDENYATTMTTALAGKQDNLTAGNGIDITGDTVSVAFDAGNGLAINGTNLTVDTNVIATKTYAEGVADDADTSARGYADSLASNYDAAGAAAAAQTAAEEYADDAVTYAIGLEVTSRNTAIDDAIDQEVTDRNSAITNAIDALRTDDVEEGYSNQYFTDTRAKGSAADLIVNATKTNITITGNEDGLTITAEGGVGDATTDDLVEGETNLYFTNSRATDAVSGSDITPNSVTIHEYRKEEAVQMAVQNDTTANLHSFSYPYESAKYLVRVVGWVGGVKHSQITEILMTVDGNDNIAMTEYGNIHTSTDALASFSATYDNGLDLYRLTVTTAGSDVEVIAAATLLSWAD